jgi:hypothetical protein
VNIKNNKVVTVSGCKDEEGTSVSVLRRNSKWANCQSWTIIYTDKAKEVATKGESKDFGFKINEPFFLVSRLPMHRVAESVSGSNIVLKTLVRTNTKQ